MSKEKCPTCGTMCQIEWHGLDLVAESGNETLASKSYTPISESQVGQSKKTRIKDSEFVPEFEENLHESKEPQGDTIEYERLIAFLSTDCGLMGYRWDEGLTGVDRIISFLKYKFGQSTQQGQEEQEVVWKDVEEVLKLSVGLDPYRSGKIIDYLKSKFTITTKPQ